MLSPANSQRSIMTPARSDSFTSFQSSSVTPTRTLSVQALDRSGSSQTLSSINQESSGSVSSAVPYEEPVKQAAPSTLNGLSNNGLHSAFQPIPHPSRLPLPVSVGPQRPVMPPLQNYRVRAPNAAQQTSNNNRHSVAGVPHFDAAVSERNANAAWHSHTRTQPVELHPFLRLGIHLSLSVSEFFHECS